eukprot:5269925-Pyramimonas_sp.AAC.1
MHTSERCQGRPTRDISDDALQAEESEPRNERLARRVDTSWGRGRASALPIWRRSPSGAQICFCHVA